MRLAYLGKEKPLTGKALRSNHYFKPIKFHTFAPLFSSPWRIQNYLNGLLLFITILPIGKGKVFFVFF